MGFIRMSIYRLLENGSIVEKSKVNGDNRCWLSVENKLIVYRGGKFNRVILLVWSLLFCMCFLVYVIIFLILLVGIIFILVYRWFN